MISKKLLKKSEWTEIDTINFLLEASASSSRFGTIKESENNNKSFTTRANIHTMLILPFGSGKTSSLLDIKNAVYNNDYTFPGVIGSISREGELVESSIIKAGGKILILDEFQRLDDSVKNALNSILEYPHNFSRTLGYKIRSPIKKKGKFYHIKAKANTNIFEVYSKFSCIASGMYVSNRTTISKAWFSRFIPIRFNPSIDFYKKLSEGKKAIKINPKLKESDFTFRNYMKLHNLFWNKYESSPFTKYFSSSIHSSERGYLVRLLQDIVRLSAYVTSLDNRKDIKIEDAEMILERFFDFIITNYIHHDLTETDLFILTNITKLSQSEMAKKLNITKQAISNRIKFLQSSRII